MNINKRAKVVIAAAALIGTAGIAGTAFTATGVLATGNAATPQFVGGTVSQTITGATLTNIEYGYDAVDHLNVDEVLLTFADSNADGQHVTLTPHSSAGTPDTDTFTCTDVSTTATVSTSDCTITGGTGAYTGLDSIDILVGSTTAALHP
jgi:hypothetical protein